MPEAPPVVPAESGSLVVRDYRFTWGARTYLMGIINVTPDSFSGDGLYPDLQAVRARARAFEDAGADLIDVGGESTRPGHEPVADDEEMRRVIPAVAAIREVTRLPLSVDTFKPAVARAALAAGADILNCVWGAVPGIVAAAAETGAPLILMHNRTQAVYAGDCVGEVIAWLESAAQDAIAAGIAPGRIILDPGIGFGKTADDNVRILCRLREFKDRLPYPLLLGISRKSFLGAITGLPVGERVFATAAAVTLCIAQGADIVRVHDVAPLRAVVDVADAVCRVGAAHAPPREGWPAPVPAPG
jgi:dihydropteroate synthase